MRVSTIFELLLIFLLVAFAAYGRVIDTNGTVEASRRSIRDASDKKQTNLGISTLSLKQATDNVNRYCTCNENICNCCRDFHIPLVRLQGPGCASLQYLQGDNLAVQLSFGDNILTSTVVNGKSPKPVCVPLPGGFSKFCGRIYSIQRDAKNHFKACLGLELQSATELEASLRVSCFRFGPDGLKLRPAEPLPLVEAETASEEDDDDDLFGLGSDDEDEDDDDDDAPTANAVPNSSAAEEDEDDDEDVLGLGALFDIITGGDETSTKKPKVTTPPPLQFTIPLLSRTTTPSPLEPHEPATSANDIPVDTDLDASEQVYDVTQEPNKADEDTSTELEDQTEGSAEVSDETVSSVEDIATEGTNKIAYSVKPNKNGSVKPNKLKKTTAAVNKKPSITSTSINALDDGAKKPVTKPVKGSGNEDDDDDDILGDDDDDDDDDDDILDDDDDKDDDDDDDDDDKDDDDDEDEDEKIENDQKHEDDEDEKAEDLDDLDDDDDEDEDAVLSALVDDGKGNKNKLSHLSSSAEEDDYSLGFTELLARKRSMRSGRQSRVMRL